MDPLKSVLDYEPKNFDGIVTIENLVTSEPVHCLISADAGESTVVPFDSTNVARFELTIKEDGMQFLQGTCGDGRISFQTEKTKVCIA